DVYKRQCINPSVWRHVKMHFSPRFLNVLKRNGSWWAGHNHSHIAIFSSLLIPGANGIGGSVRLVETLKLHLPLLSSSLRKQLISSIGIEAVPGIWTSLIPTMILSTLSVRRTAVCLKNSSTVTMRFTDVDERNMKNWHSSFGV
ncbi:hypothetical protein PG1821B_1614, partial [Bifidobacterium animalis subsp. lactis]